MSYVSVMDHRAGVRPARGTRGGGSLPAHSSFGGDGQMSSACGRWKHGCWVLLHSRGFVEDSSSCGGGNAGRRGRTVAYCALEGEEGVDDDGGDRSCDGMDSGEESLGWVEWERVGSRQQCGL